LLYNIYDGLGLYLCVIRWLFLFYFILVIYIIGWVWIGLLECFVVLVHITNFHYLFWFVAVGIVINSYKPANLFSGLCDIYYGWWVGLGC